MSQTSPKTRGPAKLILACGVTLLLLAVGAYIVARRAGLFGPGGRKPTVTTQSIVMDTVNRYRELKGKYPAGASDDCVALMRQLHEVPECRDLIKKLPQDTWNGPGTPLLDGRGKPMRYRPKGGYGGHPMLWSRGGDGRWDTEDDILCDGQ